MPALFLLFVRFFRAIYQGVKDPEFRSLLLLVGVVLGTGTWFYHAWEGWSWLDALYFSVITLTTVGYGDFSPKTDAGKVFTIFYLLVGLGILSSFIVLLAERQRESGVLGRKNGRSAPPDQE